MTTKTKYGRTVFSAIAGISMVTAMTTNVASSVEPKGNDTQPVPGPEANQASATVQSDQVTVPQVVGDFSYSQTTITPNEQIKKYFQTVSQILCGSTTGITEANPLGWQIAVSGDVGNAFVANVGELAKEQSVKSTMTCTCGGNPAGGRAIANADVNGIPIEYLLNKAQADPAANTVTFVSSDGTKTAFSIGYLIGHHAVLNYEVNGEDLSASMGGNNQLWMVKTSAKYFIRDIVSVEVSVEDEAPAAPGAADAHPNRPNVSVVEGYQE